ncbi:MAG: tryptophan--tRNA ligase [Planctomycetes bacterium]|nr:tryptophan--tRNA ligase [Planctomycetota bacterium]
MTTYLSGIQPSGLLHWGNYFGAIRQHVAESRPSAAASPDAQKPHEHYYFIADYHALTTSRNPAELRGWVREVALTYLAFGLDVDHAVFFRQSDVPEVTEIAWMLSCVTGMGVLERAVSYRDKLERGLQPNVGLFTYPALMAADILAYDSNFVPVGPDQQQHIEIAQDMAASFNALYGPVFVRPEPKISPFAKVPGLDGQKMSKSYGNHIWIFATGKELKKAVGRVVTDSRPPEEPKDPSSVLLFDLLRLFLDDAELADWKARVAQGGTGAPGYGHLKQRLIDAADAFFAPARARREELSRDPAEVERLLARGAERARARARATRDRALAACGLR